MEEIQLKMKFRMDAEKTSANLKVEVTSAVRNLPFKSTLYGRIDKYNHLIT